MHELSIAENIVDIVGDHLPPETSAVRAVKLRIGELAGVVPDSLEFCFAAITVGTPLEGARLDIESVALTGTCRTCGAHGPLQSSLFACPVCGSFDMSIVSGRELQVVEIELDDEGGV